VIFAEKPVAALFIRVQLKALGFLYALK